MGKKLALLKNLNKEVIVKYAIPVHGGRLSPHFGQSTEFMLIDANGGITSKQTISTRAHRCGSLPRLFASHGVKVVLAGGMGLSPRLAFERSGIEVVLGVSESDPEKAVLAHLNHTLISGQNVCEHGDVTCDHPGHHHRAVR
jgi:predicted Fe-Mo cluster-binding NifX family protein